MLVTRKLQQTTRVAAVTMASAMGKPETNLDRIEE